MGSADLMERNLNHRVEVVFPIENPDHIRFLHENVLDVYLRDNSRARVMEPDGTYSRLSPKDKEDKIDVQEWLMDGSFSKKAELINPVPISKYEADVPDAGRRYFRRA